MAGRSLVTGLFSVCLGVAFVAQALLAQDRAPLDNQPEAGAQVAARLLDAYDVVALGTFDRFPPPDEDLQSSLVPQEIVLRFDIKELYKGSAGDSIDVAIISDMLVYPGEEISRYSKRQEIRRIQIAAAAVLDREMAELEDARRLGNVTSQEYRDGRARLDSEKDKLVSDSLATSSRMRRPLHTQTFYDLKGAMQPNELFLIGVNRSSNPTVAFELDEVPTTVERNIFWGEQLEEVVSAIREQR